MDIRQRIAIVDLSAVGDSVTRTYTITGPVSFMRRLEAFLAQVEYMGDVGHSATAALDVDGDGNERIDIKPRLKAPKVKTRGTYPAQVEMADLGKM